MASFAGSAMSLCMRKISILLTSVCAAAFTFGCSVFGNRSGYEEPPYQVLDAMASDLEVRRYGPRLAIETEVEAQDEAQGRSEAFRILAAYLFGENEAHREIAMTTPVETASRSTEIAMTVPVETSGASGRIRMRFFPPAEFTLETLPEPKDSRVRFVEMPAETLAVLRFSGRRNAGAIASRTSELLAALASSQWSAVGEPIALFYDPPWTLPFLRRNEVAVAVRAAR